MPGVIGGIVSAIVASRMDETFGDNYDDYRLVADRSASTQAGY
jgi:hypothetical protein